MSRVLIAGCGDVGTTLGRRLAAEGHTVFGLRREPGGLPEKIRPVAADLTNPARLRTLPPELDVVFYTAASTTHDDATYRAVYVDGLRNLLAALEPQRDTLQRVIFASSSGVYGQEDGSWVDEDSDTSPPNFNGKRMVEAERVLRDSGCPGTSVRFGGIYGPGRARVIGHLLSGRALVYPGPPSYTNRTHREDCAGILAHVMALPTPAPVYVATDDDPVEFNTLMRWLAGRLGLPEPETAAVPREQNKRCRNTRLRESGYTFEYPSYREGYDEILQLEARKPFE
jgi:nucleoside-diphosphate-sugar epimerase